MLFCNCLNSYTRQYFLKLKRILKHRVFCVKRITLCNTSILRMTHNLLYIGVNRRNVAVVMHPSSTTGLHICRKKTYRPSFGGGEGWNIINIIIILCDKRFTSRLFRCDKRGDCFHLSRVVLNDPPIMYYFIATLKHNDVFRRPVEADQSTRTVLL
jgi:hypothetical protein